MMKRVLLAFAGALAFAPAALAQQQGGGGGSSGGGGSGCTVSGSGGIVQNNGSGGCATDTNAQLSAGALSLGASGTAGSLTIGNASTGTITIAPVTGALGTVTLSLPDATDTLVGRATTDTLTNKTLTSPAINGGALSGTLSGNVTLSGIVTLSGTDNFTGTVEVGGNAMTFPGTAASLASIGTITSGDLCLGLTSPEMQCSTALGSGVLTALSNAVNGSGGLVTSAQTYTTTLPVVWDSNTNVANGTTTVLVAPWTGGGTITGVTALTNGSGSPSFSVEVEIGGAGVTGCTAITVSSSTASTTGCTGANTLSSGSVVSVVVSSVSGAPDEAYVGVNITHTAN